MNNEDQSPILFPIADLIDAVVLVACCKGQQIVSTGSGFVVDGRDGLIVTASHTLMNISTRADNTTPVATYYGDSVAIGILRPPSPSSATLPRCATFTYWAKVVAKDPNMESSQPPLCRVDACVLRITHQFQTPIDVSNCQGGGRQYDLLGGVSSTPIDPGSLSLPFLSLTTEVQLDEEIRVFGFNQEGEGLVAQGHAIHGTIDLARGYVCKLSDETTQALVLSPPPNDDSFQPQQEIAINCFTIAGHSGGPCTNQYGQVIGILSRGHPDERHRCYLAPTAAWISMLDRDAVDQARPITRSPSRVGSSDALKAYIKERLALLDKEVALDLRKIRSISRIQDIIQGIEGFRSEVEAGVVKERKSRLRQARDEVFGKDDFDNKWVVTWANDLLPQGERNRVWDAVAHIRANELDGDRKVCVELLKQFHKYCENNKVSAKEAKKQFPPRLVEDILCLTLAFDRAKALYFMPRAGGESNERGLHWYSQKDVDTKKEWQAIQEQKGYDGDPTISKSFTWFRDSGEYGSHLSERTKVLMEPQKAFETENGNESGHKETWDPTSRLFVLSCCVVGATCCILLPLAFRTFKETVSVPQSMSRTKPIRFPLPGTTHSIR